MNEIERIQESSQYLATLLRGRQHYMDWLLARKNLHRRFPLTELYEDLQKAARRAQTFSALLTAFRDFKQRHFLRIGGRDLLGWADLPETTGQISDLAAVALQVNLDALSQHPDWWLAEEEAKSWGRVREAAQLVVLGLGKLGGRELNYVSDVDLVFLHAPKPGREAPDGRASMFLERLCQWLSRLLAESAEGDRVFLVDHRLRPHGKDGPLVPSSAEAAVSSRHGTTLKSLKNTRWTGTSQAIVYFQCIKAKFSMCCARPTWKAIISELSRLIVQTPRSGRRT